MKDKPGSPLKPSILPPSIDQNKAYGKLVQENQKLENELNDLRISYKRSLIDAEDLDRKVKNLESNAVKIKTEKYEHSEDLSSQISNKDSIIKELRLKVISLHQENERLVKSVKDLNQKIRDSSIETANKHEVELGAREEVYKKELEAFKKEQKEKIKLLNKQLEAKN